MGWGSGQVEGFVRFLTLVPRACRLELQGCREGQLRGHWKEGYSLGLQSGHLKASRRRQRGTW